MNVAILSNSYGEDRSGALVAKELKSLNKKLRIRAFPLISLGEEYEKRNIKVIGGHPPTPSGGFLLKSAKGFFADISKTFFIPFSYINRLRKFRKTTDIIIVIGDIPILILGYISLRKKAYFLEQCKSNYISPHFAVERFLMQKLTNKVFTHDKITAEDLQNKDINAEFFGNTMMDELQEEGKYSPPQGKILIGLLPGSRRESYINMRKIANVVKEMLARRKNLHFAVALSDTVDKNKMMESVVELRQKIDFRYGSFVDIVKRSKLAISLGGTASEQALYLESPVISFIGSGSQNTKRRLKGQKKLLGDALILFPYKPKKIAEKTLEIIENKELLEKLKVKGRERAGESGGARKIANYIYNKEVKTRIYHREHREINCVKEEKNTEDTEKK
jgi:tetraacyldisaccharide 4'-kinase